MTKLELNSDLWRGLTVQARCIYALMLRDLMMRYGRDNIGFLWVVVEAMILTVGVMIIWSTLRQDLNRGVGIVLLAFTGYMLLTMWRHFTNAGMRLFELNAGLLYHRHISLLDTFVSRLFLEFAAMTTSLVVVGTVLVDAGLIEPPHDLGIIVVGWLSMAALSSSVALNLAVLTEYSKVAERLVPPFQYFMLPVSGAFFMVSWLSTSLRNLAWYIPTVHCYEMFRAGFVGEQVLTYYSIWYPLAWSLSLTCLGVWGMEKVRNRIHFG